MRSLHASGMNAGDSLDTGHHELAQQIEGVIAAGREGRWDDYRLRFERLCNDLAKHMAYEEEVLFPSLETDAAQQVSALREVHVRLREHMEAIGAAAPQHDPEGCLGELDTVRALISRWRC